MLSVEKRNHHAKRKWMISMLLLIGLSLGISGVYLLMPQETVPVFSQKLRIKVADKMIDEEPVLPYVSGSIVMDYFDGTSNAIPTVNEYEGIYRPSLGVAIANNNEPFEVVSALSGKVVDIIQDPLLGLSASIESDDVLITYQSLGTCYLKEGDVIKQNDLIGTAGSNSYQSGLLNHLYIVTEMDGKVVNPHLLFSFE